MAFFDLPLDQLKTYLPARMEPADFAPFWEETLAETRSYPLNACYETYDSGLRNVQVFDVTFNGYGGQPIKGWLLLPAGHSRPLPCVVEYIGYGGGRSFPLSFLGWSSAGYAHLVMDTRGQGSTWSPGDTPDPEPDGANPHIPGFMTRGILSPRSYYYRRVFADAVRAVEAARSHTSIDADRIAVTGGSQGGGITIAAAGLDPTIKVVMPEVPFLCHYRRATQIVNTYPYFEISNFLKTHRERVEQVFETLSYFDCVNLGTRAKGTALFSVGLMDEICPPSTVFAAYNHYAGPKQIKVYEYNNHEGGGPFHAMEKLRFLDKIWPDR